jgi:FkbM family methyltransferase
MTPMRRAREWLRNAMRSAGLELSRFPVPSSALERRGRLLRHLGTDLVLDVGANEGQYGRELRGPLAYRGRIVSFEPLPQACRQLRLHAARAQPWAVHELALGRDSGMATLRVSGHAESSSLLPMRPAHLAAEPRSAEVGAVPVRIATLDALWPGLRQGAARVWLKIDTQGFEAQVLDGAAAALREIHTVQLELSLLPLYEGAASAETLHRRLLRQGFRLVGVEPGFCEPHSGRLLQLDGIYHRGGAA